MKLHVCLALGLIAGCSSSNNEDTGVALDVGATPDFGPIEDAGLQRDLGPGQDAGNAPDSGTPIDMGTPVDAGPADLGVQADSGVARNDTLSFFVTSQGNGARGGNYGGLSGADGFCQGLAAAQGAGHRTWRAYLSVHPGAGGSETVNARDRIGSGPWMNAGGQMVAQDVDALHTNGLDSALMMDEMGQPIPTNEHDILTGTRQDGTAWTEFPGNPNAPPPTCLNWTDGTNNAFVYVGHHDWSDPNTAGNPVWNASHETDCSEQGLNSTAGTGRLYCFAAD